MELSTGCDCTDNVFEQTVVCVCVCVCEDMDRYVHTVHKQVKTGDQNRQGNINPLNTELNSICQ